MFCVSPQAIKMTRSFFTNLSHSLRIFKYFFMLFMIHKIQNQEKGIIISRVGQVVWCLANGSGRFFLTRTERSPR